MKHIALTILTYTALVLQSSVSESLSIGVARPEFLTAVWAVVLLTTTGRTCFLWAGLIGLLDDCLTDQPLGISMIVFVLTSAVVQKVFDPRGKRSPALEPVLLLVTIFPALLLSTTGRAMLSGWSVDASTVLTTEAATAVYSTVLVIGGLIAGRIARHLVPSRVNHPAVQRPNRFRLLTK